MMYRVVISFISFLISVQCLLAQQDLNLTQINYQDESEDLISHSINEVEESWHSSKHDTNFAVAHKSNYYFGVSYGKSLPIGDFKDNDINNSDAGFAESGNKLDVYGGYVLSDRMALTLTFRYQNFDTDIDALVSGLKADNQGLLFSGSSDSWQTCYLLVGVEYRIGVSEKLSLFPRLGLGPVFVSNPTFSVDVIDGNSTTGIDRSSKMGSGLGYEFGIGLKRDIGKNFCLMPTFTFGGGFVKISDVETTINSTTSTSNYTPKVSAFNLGLSLAYKF